MQDCKTLNAKVQVVAWLSTFTRLVSAFQCFEVVNVCRCLYVTWDSFISERAQTDGEVNLRSLHARSWERCDLNAWLQIDVNIRPRGLKMFQRQRKMSSYATLTRQCRLTQCSKKKNNNTWPLPTWKCSHIIPRYPSRRFDKWTTHDAVSLQKCLLESQNTALWQYRSIKCLWMRLNVKSQPSWMYQSSQKKSVFRLWCTERCLQVRNLY